MSANQDNVTSLPNQKNLPVEYNQQAIQAHAYNTSFHKENEDEDEIDLRQLWQVLVRRKGLIFFVALLVFSAAALVTMSMTPVYRASTTLQINPDDTQVLEYDVETRSTPVNTKDFYQTQYELLQSRNLAERVINQLALEETLRGPQLAKPFFAESLEETQNFLQSFFRPADTKHPALSTTQLIGKEPVENLLLENLTVQPVKNSQIVTLHYDDPDPQQAKIIANALADNFVEMNLQRRRDSATYAEGFLENEIDLARGKLQVAEATLNAYAKERGILNVEGTGSLTAARLQELSNAVNKAEQDRIKAESDYRQASRAEGTREALTSQTVQALKERLARLEARYQAHTTAPQSFNDPTIRALRQRLLELQSEYQAELQASNAVNNDSVQTMKRTLAQLQTQLRGGVSALETPTTEGLKRQLADLQSQYQEQLQIYKPAYPSMVQQQQKINEIRQQINQEHQAARRSLTQRITQLQNEINQETRLLTNNKRTNLKQQIDRITADIARETRNLDGNTSNDLQRQIAELRNQIARESNSISNSIIGDLRAKFAAAQQREETLKQQFSDQTLVYTTLQDKTIEYNNLRREVESSRNIYTSLLDRQKEVGVAGGVGTNNISVVDPAVTPFQVHKPNVKLNLALGSVLGLFLGTVLAFLLEFLDDRIKSVDELQSLLSLPLLGLIPLTKQKQPSKLAMMTQTDPRSAFAESFRSLRTNLMFSTSQGTPQTLAITSSAPNEGKSTSSINIATAFTQAGQNVLLVDADLRNPSIHKLLNLENKAGLTNILTNQSSIEDATQNCQIPNLYVITAGPISPNPVELLSSDNFDQLTELVKQQTFDLIIFDCPPVLGLADALIIGSRVHACLMATTLGESKKQTLADAYKRMLQSRSNVIGTVSTKTKQGAKYGYGYNYEYYNYGQDKKLLDAA